jgi:hypothetical protein
MSGLELPSTASSKNTGDNAADFIYEVTVPEATRTAVTTLTQTSPTSATVRHGTALQRTGDDGDDLRRGRLRRDGVSLLSRCGRVE